MCTHCRVPEIADQKMYWTGLEVFRGITHQPPLIRNTYIKKFSTLFMSESDPIIKIIKTGMFPISDISYGRLQARTRSVSGNLESIKKSMEKFGQLVAITIFENNGKYELLTGLRRLNAAIALGWSEIRADLIEKPPEDLISKAISFIENEIRQKMPRADVINVCNEFYYKYGSMKAVSEELALPYELVRDAVKLPRCPSEVKQAVEDGVISLRTAIKATDALKWDADKPQDGTKVLELGKRLEDNMPRELQKSVIEVGKADPDKPLDDIIKEAKSVKKTRLKISFGAEEHGRLSKYASAEEVDEEEAAANLILDGLSERGY